MVAFFSYVGGESLNSEVYISKLNENEQPSKKKRTVYYFKFSAN